MNNKKLYRSNHDKKIAGICGGLGEFANIDSNIFRIVFLFAAFLGGVGLIAYLILFFVIPAENAINQSDDKTKSEVEYTPYTEVNSQDGNSEDSATNKSADSQQKDSCPKNEKSSIAIIGGVVFIGLGAFLLLSYLIPNVLHKILFPSALILCGILLLLFCKKK